MVGGIISVENVGGTGGGVVWVLCCMGVLNGCVGVGVMTVDVGTMVWGVCGLGGR